MPLLCTVLAVASLFCGAYLAHTHTSDLHTLIAFQSVGLFIAFLILAHISRGPGRVRT